MTEFFSSSVAERLVMALIHFLWQGTLLCLLYSIAVNLSLLRTPRTRYLFGLSVFGLMALSPVLTFSWLGWISGPEALSSPAAAGYASASLSTVTYESFGFVSPQTVLTCWMFGVMVLSVRLLNGYRQLRRWRIETVELPAPLQTRIAALCRRIGLRSIPNVKLSVHVTEAMALGFWKPAILLPVSWAIELPVSTLEAILAHELAHIRRFDLWVNLGQRFVETMLFYHPGVWWLSNRIREERELCCDEMAARATGESLGYAIALEGVARYLAGSHTLLGTSFLGDRKMKLLQRVRHVLGQSSSTRRKLWWPAGIMALMLPIGIYGTSLTAQDSPREGDRPRAERERPRDGERERPREVERDRPREGDRERPPREGDRPRGDGDRPRPPREGDRPPRGEGDRPPREGDRPRPPREGIRPLDRPRPGGAEGPRDLIREIEALREEVRQLREEIRRQGPPPPPPAGFRPFRDVDGPRRPGFGPLRDDDGPPRGEGDRPRPPRGGEGPPRGEGDRPRPPREGDGPPRGEGDRPRPPREFDRPRERDQPRREGDRPRNAEREERPERPDRPREGEREERPDRPRGERPERPDRPETEVPAE